MNDVLLFIAYFLLGVAIARFLKYMALFIRDVFIWWARREISMRMFVDFTMTIGMFETPHQARRFFKKNYRQIMRDFSELQRTNPDLLQQNADAFMAEFEKATAKEEES